VDLGLPDLGLPDLGLPDWGLPDWGLAHFGPAHLRRALGARALRGALALVGLSGGFPLELLHALAALAILLLAIEGLLLSFALLPQGRGVLALAVAPGLVFIRTFQVRAFQARADRRGVLAGLQVGGRAGNRTAR
jgi:NAD(P)-dependent dehydrogenase (short-subunit alcohol dehydrogenase family)